MSNRPSPSTSPSVMSGVSANLSRRCAGGSVAATAIIMTAVAVDNIFVWTLECTDPGPWMSRNETRECQNMNPSDELDTLLEPLNARVAQLRPSGGLPSHQQ